MLKNQDRIWKGTKTKEGFGRGVWQQKKPKTFRIAENGLFGVSSKTQTKKTPKNKNSRSCEKPLFLFLSCTSANPKKGKHLKIGNSAKLKHPKLAQKVGGHMFVDNYA